MVPDRSPGGTLRSIVGYSLMIGGAVALFLVVLSVGSKLSAPALSIPAAAPAAVPAAGPGAPDVLLHVLLALSVVIIAGRALGAVLKLIHQPPVLGEVLAGIMIGPSLLGHVWPAATSFLLPSSIAPFLSIIAQIGVILFMFLVGLELDTSQLKDRGGATLAISHASIVVPFVLGSILALWLYPMLSTSNVPFTVFALFIGVSLSVTAFPVLARILIERGMQRTRIGVIALTCAAVGDVTAWCLLAFIVATAKAKIAGAAITFGLTALYLAFMLLVARPLAERAVRAQDARQSVSQAAFAVVVVALLLSTLATQAVGIHAIFGGFLLGAIIPHDSQIARHLTDKLRDIVVVLFLPAYFAFTGMRTQIGLVDGISQWVVCGVILAAASVGKFGGTFVAARITGLGSRDAASLGILMNTRGLMELIVLNVGLDLGILSPTLFAMLVLMAIVTTFATTPILHMLTVGQPSGEPIGQSATPRGSASAPVTIEA
jgi:Kef-type K+ transport system membrane component KefB